MSSEKEIDKLGNEIAKEEIQVKLIEVITEKNSKNTNIKILAYVLTSVLLILFGVSWLFTTASEETQNLVIDWLSGIFNKELFLFIMVGLGAQMVDGALGMAYGATASSFLLSLGVSPSMSSASIHIAEVFTTGASGLSHLKLGNVNKKLFQTLLIPGMIGAVLGALVISFADGADSESFVKNYVKPIMSAYLMILGIIVLRKAFRKVTERKKFSKVTPLALFGGFMDSVGGGGWGPIVTSTLIS
ncbi:MAG: sulfite exporter TauE/SafE family protein, partial [Cytophagales bacterium]